MDSAVPKSTVCGWLLWQWEEEDGEDMLGDDQKLGAVVRPTDGPAMLGSPGFRIVAAARGGGGEHGRHRWERKGLAHR